jgi:hypothetical protein
MASINRAGQIAVIAGSRQEARRTATENAGTKRGATEMGVKRAML